MGESVEGRGAVAVAVAVAVDEMAVGAIDGTVFPATVGARIVGLMFAVAAVVAAVPVGGFAPAAGTLTGRGCDIGVS